MNAWSNHVDESLLEHLMAYVDNELDPMEMREVDDLICKNHQLRMIVLELWMITVKLTAMYEGAEKHEAPNHPTLKSWL